MTIPYKRPVNLSLTTIKFPVTAIVSILHRISGVVIFLFLPFVLYYFHLSITSQDGFALLQTKFQQPLLRFLAWCFTVAFVFHGLAGIRHLLMDMGFQETLAGGRRTAWLVFVIFVVLAILAGIYLWD